MSTRESLHAFVESLSEDEAEVRWRELAAQADEDDPSKPHAPQAVIDARRYPALAAIWDHDDDSIFDDL